MGSSLSGAGDAVGDKMQQSLEATLLTTSPTAIFEALTLTFQSLLKLLTAFQEDKENSPNKGGNLDELLQAIRGGNSRLFFEALTYSNRQKEETQQIASLMSQHVTFLRHRGLDDGKVRIVWWVYPPPFPHCRDRFEEKCAFLSL